MLARGPRPPAVFSLVSENPLAAGIAGQQPRAAVMRNGLALVSYFKII